MAVDTRGRWWGSSMAASEDFNPVAPCNLLNVVTIKRFTQYTFVYRTGAVQSCGQTRRRLKAGGTLVVGN